jgi:hypothetical protein
MERTMAKQMREQLKVEFKQALTKFVATFIQSGQVAVALI